MAIPSNINKDVPMEQFQHVIPTQIKYMITQMAGLQGQPVRDAVNMILIKKVFKYFSNMDIVHILKAKYEENTGMPWCSSDAFFGNNKVEEEKIEEGDDEEDTLLEEAG